MTSCEKVRALPGVGERGTDGAVPMYQPAHRVDIRTESILMHISAQAKVAEYRIGPCTMSESLLKVRGKNAVGGHFGLAVVRCGDVTLSLVIRPYRSTVSASAATFHLYFPCLP